jgi:hypothetical protein
MLIQKSLQGVPIILAHSCVIVLDACNSEDNLQKLKPLKISWWIVHHDLQLYIGLNKCLVNVSHSKVLVYDLTFLANILEFKPVNAWVIALAHLANEYLLQWLVI